MTLALLILLLAGCRRDDMPTPDMSIGLQIPGKSFRFAAPSSTGIANAYMIGSNQDQLSIVMDDGEGYSCEIHLLQTDMLNRNFPFTLSDTSALAYGELQLRDNTRRVDTLFGPNDDINFAGYTHRGLVIELTSFQNNILVGTVSGPIATGAGRQVVIGSGDFRVLIEIRR
ncbi:MAG: hypothetical protein OHK0039_20780 [Bacteroidia bacterium]